MGDLRGKRGQIAIFVIIALVIAASIIVYFVFRGSIGVSDVPEEFAPIYDFYEECITYEVASALDLAGSQGGDLYLDDYVPGSDFAPFSSHLNFLGFPVPYWFYVSGNGIVKENVPTMNEIEEEVERYLEERINDCDFDEFYARGYSIELDESPSAKIDIQSEKVLISLTSAVVSTNVDGDSARKSNYDVEINSKFGKFFEIATSVYEKETSELFLENYALDVLRMYAPVDGVEIDCAPTIWKTREVVDEFKTGLEANIGAIKLRGDYYKLSNKEREYFVVDVDSDESVNFLYSSDWPTKVEIAGVDELMMAKPVGNQEGMGVMGFCYSPYHFVYDVSFPVVVQIYDNEEIFQFPIGVIIDNNLPREADLTEIGFEKEEDDLCGFDNQQIRVDVFDSSLNPVDAELSYICFATQCELGRSEGGTFVGMAPTCYNGLLKAKADGYIEKTQLFSTNEESSADILLDREYEMDVELLVGGNELEGTAVVSFAGENVKSVVLPNSDKVVLSEGAYNVSVYVYGDTDITLPASSKRECVDTPRTDLLGFFGATEERCFDIEIPETKLDTVLIGGGEAETYILESQLMNRKVTIRADSLSTPKSLEELQYNYAAFESNNIYLTFG